MRCYTYMAILSLCIAYSNCHNIFSNILTAPQDDPSLDGFLQQRQLEAVDPATSKHCFDNYLPQLQQVANQWSVDHDNCLQRANVDSSSVTDNMRAQNAQISEKASSVCTKITSCQNMNSTLQSFICFSSLRHFELDVIYTISNNASDNAALLTQQLELINNDMYKCSNASERIYIEKTASLYHDLDLCLKHASSNSATPETTSTTEQPETLNRVLSLISMHDKGSVARQISMDVEKKSPPSLISVRP